MSLGTLSPSASRTSLSVTSSIRGVQLDVDAALDQLDPGVLAQLLVEGTEQRGRHLDQADVHPGRVDVGEGGAEHGAAQLGQRACQLDAGGAAADHGDGQVAVRAFLAQPLEARHQVVAQHHRVGAGVQGEGVLGGALDAVVRGRHAGRDDQVVVAELAAVGERDPAGRRVDRGELAAPVDRAVAPDEAAHRVADVAGVEACRGHLVEQRLEGAVEVAVQQGDPHARAGERLD